METELEGERRLREALRAYVVADGAAGPLVARDLLVAGRKVRRRRHAAAVAVAGLATASCAVAAVAVVPGGDAGGHRDTVRIAPAAARMTDAEAITRYTRTFRARLEKMLPGAPEDPATVNYPRTGKPFQFDVEKEHEVVYAARAVPVTAHGKGTVEVSVWPAGYAERCRSGSPTCEVRRGPHGERIVVVSEPGRFAENHASVQRPDGSEVVVRAWVGTAEDPTATAPGTARTPVLSRDQVADLVMDPSFTLYR